MLCGQRGERDTMSSSTRHEDMLAPNLPVPPDAATRTLAILGQKGAGKTSAAQRLTEIMVRRGDQVVVLDPTGVWWGLRSGADGNLNNGLDVIIMGGDHADVPLEPSVGEVVAEFIIASGRSVVLDMSAFESGAAHVRFATGLALRLYHGKSSHRSPLHLMMDEADTFGPQMPQPGERAMLGAFESIVRRGRSRGLGMTMITQRPACLNKNLLSQVDAVLCMRITGKNDMNTMWSWIGQNMTNAGLSMSPSDFVNTLPRLGQGEAWWWSPAWTRAAERVKVLMKTTYDSSSTPTQGAVHKPPAMRKVDLDVLTAQIRATTEQLKSNHPDELKKVIAGLRKRVAELEAAAAKVKEVPALTQEDRKNIQNLIGLLQGGTVKKLAGLAPCASPQPPRQVNVQAPQAMLREPRRTEAPEAPAASIKLGKAERSILTALMQTGGASKARVAAMSGYAVNGGGFNNALSRLRSTALILAQGDHLRITPDGESELGSDWKPLPTGEAAVKYWAQKEGKAAGLILEALYESHARGDGGLTRLELAERTGYAADGGGFNNALSKLRTLELIEGRDRINISRNLIEP